MIGVALVVDPGLRGCGVSIWVDGMLVWAGYVLSPCKPPVRGPAAWRAMARAVRDTYPLAADWLVVELQQDDSRVAVADDLRQLSGVVGALTGLYDEADVVGYLPGEWSLVPKEIRHARLPKQLTAEELAALEDDNHNTLDAVALGLFEMKQRGRTAEAA